MRALRHWKAILALTLMFAAGAVIGSVLTVVHFKKAFEHALRVENWTNDAMRIMRKDLHLTPEQEPRIRVILEDTTQHLKASFGRAVDESGTNIVSAWQRIDQELTPEQRVVHQQKCREFREGLKKALNIELPTP